MQKRRNDCEGCIMPEVRRKIVNRGLVPDEYCPYNQSFPHAINCATAHYETVECHGVGIGQEIEVGED